MSKLKKEIDEILQSFSLDSIQSYKKSQRNQRKEIEEIIKRECNKNSQQLCDILVDEFGHFEGSYSDSEGDTCHTTIQDELPRAIQTFIGTNNR